MFIIQKKIQHLTVGFIQEGFPMWSQAINDRLISITSCAPRSITIAQRYMT
ncbi:hypothetical protein GXY_02808 [Novacetimonas hansenii ATCC 23769]|uniref:Uncharacterized protein n=1 Tax=Novacetimonas hansenii ATCC 23769 TaxID=714995 RepID=D5QBR5_NOVHA|nr:hypothetical protein GXY_02808 [Novacetimonas hansenii ATCC 23769]